MRRRDADDLSETKPSPSAGSCHAGAFEPVDRALLVDATGAAGSSSLASAFAVGASTKKSCARASAAAGQFATDLIVVELGERRFDRPVLAFCRLARWHRCVLGAEELCFELKLFGGRSVARARGADRLDVEARAL